MIRLFTYMLTISKYRAIFNKRCTVRIRRREKAFGLPLYTHTHNIVTSATLTLASQPGY